MDPYRIIEVKQSVFADNDRDADALRARLDDAETAAIRAGLTITKAPEERVELSAGTAPYTDDWRVGDIPIEEKFRQGSQN